MVGKKRLVAIIAAAVIGSSLIGCGSSAGTSSTSNGNSNGDVKNIGVMH